MKNIFRYIIPAALAAVSFCGCHERYVTYSDAEYVLFADTLKTYPVQPDVEYFAIPVVSTVKRNYDRTFGVEIIDKGNSRELLIELTETYKSQDLDRLWELFKESMTSYEYDAVIKVRNLNWEKQMKELLPKQTTIFVVGAGHLPGEYGMINLLREAGYKVTPVKK